MATQAPEGCLGVGALLGEEAERGSVLCLLRNTQAPEGSMWTTARKKSPGLWWPGSHIAQIFPQKNL